MPPPRESTRRVLDIGLLTPACRGYNALDGGIATHFAELAAGLVDLGHSVRMLVVASQPLVPTRPRELDRVEFVPIAAGVPGWMRRLTRWHWPLDTLAGRWGAIRGAARALQREHARQRFDCIETDSSGLLALAYLRRGSRPPVVTRVSTTESQLAAHGGNAPRWHERVLQRWERRLVRASDVVVTHTAEHRREVAREFGLAAEQVRLLTLGIAVPPDLELRPADPTRPPRLLFVGRFEVRKGIDTLLAALPGLLAAVPGVTCRLVGRDYNGYWERHFWAENPVLERARVEFAGPVDAAALRNAYRDCDVLVAPSRYESFGLIYAEAMAWGKPVIGCRAGGIPEVVLDGETGLLVAPGDSDALRNALIQLLRDPAVRRRFGEAGRQRVQNCFSRGRLAQQSAALYAESIGDGCRAA